MRPLNTDKCGTASNYKGHLSRGEKPCEPCRKANADYRRSRYVPRPKRAPAFDAGKCGTYANFRAHTRLGEHPCNLCWEAKRKYHNDRRERERARYKPRTHCKHGHLLDPNRTHKRLCQSCVGFKPEKCGTVSNYSAHERHQVPMCEPCREAWSEHRRAKARPWAIKPKKKAAAPVHVPEPVKLRVPAFLTEMYGDECDSERVPA